MPVLEEALASTSQIQYLSSVSVLSCQYKNYSGMNALGFAYFFLILQYHLIVMHIFNSIRQSLIKWSKVDIARLEPVEECDNSVVMRFTLHIGFDEQAIKVKVVTQA